MLLFKLLPTHSHLNLALYTVNHLLSVLFTVLHRLMMDRDFCTSSDGVNLHNTWF